MRAGLEFVVLVAGTAVVHQAAGIELGAPEFIEVGQIVNTHGVKGDVKVQPWDVTPAQLASLADETPEGRSIVVLAKKQFGIRGRHMDADHIVFIPFSASTRMSGVDIAEHDGRPAVSIRKGAAESVAQWVKIRGGTFPQEVEMMVQNVARVGGTPLVVARGKDVLGVIYLKDIFKGGIRERFARLRAMGIRTVMVTGDNALTAASIAAEAGVDDFMAEATPEMKLARIREEQAAGRLVAMTGDGTNDAPALAQADVGVAMNTGTQAAREAGNMVDLDSNPTKLIEIVEIGKQMLITRGALTKLMVAFSAYRESAKTQGSTGTLFSDVGSGSAYAPYVRIAVQQGWISGYTDGTFRPEQYITRAETVTMINRMLGRNYETATELHSMACPFPDVSQSNWAYGNIMEAAITHKH